MDCHHLFAILAGLVVAGPAGWMAVDLFIRLANWLSELQPKQWAADEPMVPGSLVGYFERFFAFGLVAAGLSKEGIATLLVAWTGAKLLSNWHARESNAEVRSRAFVALMAGVLSLAFGVGGGYLTVIFFG